MNQYTVTGKKSKEEDVFSLQAATKIAAFYGENVTESTERLNATSKCPNGYGTMTTEGCSLQVRPHNH